MSAAEDFMSLFFPKICYSCSKSLYKYEQCICKQCIYHLPTTGYHLNANNPVARLFWGRVNVQFAASHLRFTKGGNVQQLIHQFKYEGKKEIGFTLGKLYGRDLLATPKDFDVIIPVPLHKKKKQKRGYNQSDFFAEGLSSIMNIEYQTDVLMRVNSSGTQTKRSRFSRWQNVESVFKVKNGELLHGKHILLVDDVVTTGSTLEACANKILELPNTKVSIITMAYAEM